MALIFLFTEFIEMINHPSPYQKDFEKHGDEEKDDNVIRTLIFFVFDVFYIYIFFIRCMDLYSTSYHIISVCVQYIHINNAISYQTKINH